MVSSRNSVVKMSMLRDCSNIVSSPPGRKATRSKATAGMAIRNRNRRKKDFKPELLFFISTNVIGRRCSDGRNGFYYEQVIVGVRRWTLDSLRQILWPSTPLRPRVTSRRWTAYTRYCGLRLRSGHGLLLDAGLLAPDLTLNIEH